MISQTLLIIPSRLLCRRVPCRIVRTEDAGDNWCLLLHGYGGNENSWLGDVDAAALAEQNGLNLVIPGCGDGYYENTREPMLRFLGEELPEYLARELDFSRNREDISVAGVSMGGFGALLLAGSYPRVYGKCAALGGAFVLEDVVTWNQRVLGNASYLYFQDVFGDFDTLLGSDRDPEAMALKAIEEGLLGPVWLACGKEDPLIAANRKIANNLRAAGGRIRFTALPGGHHWQCWHREVKKVFRWMGRHRGETLTNIPYEEYEREDEF